MNRFSRAAILVSLLFVAPFRLPAQTPTDWQITPLLSAAPITVPGGSSVYPGLPVVSGNTLTFAGYSTDACGATGIYSLNGSAVKKIADTQTRIPNDYRRFDHFSDEILSYGDRVAFAGSATESGNNGVYLSQNGRLSVVADSTTFIPGSTNPFISAYLPYSTNSINADHLIFNGYGNGVSGLFSRERDDSLIRIADNTILVPGTNLPFRNFVNAQLMGDKVAFTNNTSGIAQGAYVYDHGNIKTIANGNTLVPGTNATFKTVYELAYGEKRQVIAGRYIEGSAYRYGLYENTPTGLVTLLDPNTLLPADVDYTYSPAQLLASGDTLAFTVYSHSPTGGVGFYEPLFINRNGITERLLKRGDLVDGRTVSNFYPLQFDAGRLILQVGFSDNSFGYFSAQAVPEAGGIMWGLAGAVGMIGWKWSRNRAEK